ATSLTIYADSTDDELHKNSLFKRFTYRGSGRRRRYEGNVKIERIDWGNYLSYVEKANLTFKEFNRGDQIKRQSRKIWMRFDKLMKLSEEEIVEGRRLRRNLIKKDGDS